MPATSCVNGAPTVAEQAELVGRRCGVVSICVVDDTQLREVIGQLRRELRPGSVVLVHSSVLPEHCH